MKYLLTLMLSLLLVLLSACQTNPITGRSQAMLMSRQSENHIGEQLFQELLKQSKAVANPAQQRMVKRVFERVTLAAEQLYYARTGEKLGFKWQIILIDKPDVVNAFALPGGKFGFYSGILPIAKTNAGLAVIMGHEAAHALLRHSAERYSNMQILGLGGLAAGIAGGEVGSQVYGAAAQYGYALPFSRSQETEADLIGLELSSMAGYDPRAAIGVWQRMDQVGPKVIEFASTHPNPGTRIEDMQAIMPEMLKLYDLSQRQKTVPIPGVS